MHHGIHDLFRHTSGLTYGGRGTTPVHKLYPGGSGGAAAQYTGEEFIAKLSHENLVEIYDFGLSQDGQPYAAMELLSGHSLEHEMMQGPVAFVQSAVPQGR